MVSPSPGPSPAGRERGDVERAITLRIRAVVPGYWSPLPQRGGGAGGEGKLFNMHTNFSHGLLQQCPK
jgi:hypothetical protein